MQEATFANHVAKNMRDVCCLHLLTYTAIVGSENEWKLFFGEGDNDNNLLA